MGRRRNELRNAADFILRLRVIVAEQDLKISFYKQILWFPPPPLLASASSLRLLWRRHWTAARSAIEIGLIGNPKFDLSTIILFIHSFFCS